VELARAGRGDLAAGGWLHAGDAMLDPQK